MLHLLPQSEPEAQAPYAEAVSRLASVRHALRLVGGGFGNGPEADIDLGVAAAWPHAGEARQRYFNRRSAQLVGTAAFGIEALLGERSEGREPHQAASRTLLDQIHNELRSVAGIVLG